MSLLFGTNSNKCGHRHLDQKMRRIVQDSEEISRRRPKMDFKDVVVVNDLTPWPTTKLI